MVIRNWIVAIAAAAGFASAPAEAADPKCAPLPNAGLCAFVEMIDGPKSGPNGNFVLTFTRLNATETKVGDLAVPAENVSVKLWMTSMGHGSSPVAVRTYGDGVYYVSKVNFMMAGDWDIQVSLSSARGTETATIPVVVR